MDTSVLGLFAGATIWTSSNTTPPSAGRARAWGPEQVALERGREQVQRGATTSGPPFAPQPGEEEAGEGRCRLESPLAGGGASRPPFAPLLGEEEAGEGRRRLESPLAGGGAFGPVWGRHRERKRPERASAAWNHSRPEAGSRREAKCEERPVRCFILTKRYA